jgi:succinate dehydrogenase / fumarate reductase, flavoprotein subunit
VVLATGGIGKAYKVTSNSWEYTGDGVTWPGPAPPDGHGVRAVPPHRHGLAAVSVRGILVTEACAATAAR